MERPLEMELEETVDVAGSLEEDPQQFLWAVSYSDLLMVLVSFFIVYFSFVETSEKNILEVISVSLKGKRTAPQRAIDSIKTTSVSPDLLDQIKATFDKNAKIEKDHTGSSTIRFDLADNIFRPGQYELNEDAKKSIAHLFKILKPYNGRLTLTFLGHADGEPVHLRKNSAVRSNMSLSSLRSTRGVEYAVELGADPRFVWSESFAEYGRNTRSLSIRIRERAAE